MKLIILDRDGVINEDSDAYVKSVEEWRPIPGSLQAIARLNHRGYRVFVATNQSGIARGMFDVVTLHSMHQKMAHLLGKVGGRIEGVFFCPHGPDDHCDCRKPKPGLYQQIARRARVRLDRVHAVGDSLRDITAAQLAGAHPVLVRTGKGKATESSGQLPDGVQVYDSLSDFVDGLLRPE